MSLSGEGAEKWGQQRRELRRAAWDECLGPAKCEFKGPAARGKKLGDSKGEFWRREKRWRGAFESGARLCVKEDNEYGG